MADLTQLCATEGDASSISSVGTPSSPNKMCCKISATTVYGCDVFETTSKTYSDNEIVTLNSLSNQMGKTSYNVIYVYHNDGNIIPSSTANSITIKEAPNGNIYGFFDYSGFNFENDSLVYKSSGVNGSFSVAKDTTDVSMTATTGYDYLQCQITSTITSSDTLHGMYIIKYVQGRE